MGQEIDQTEFCEADFADFHQRLSEETKILEAYFKDKAFKSDTKMCGFELEACLVDRDANPAPLSEEFLRELKNPCVVPELSQFNVEFNSLPHEVGGGLLSTLADELSVCWKQCQKAAEASDSKIISIGMLPTLTRELLSEEYMAHRKRFMALRQEVLRLRGGEPIQIDIHGDEDLKFQHRDLMLIAATTSLQIHVQTPPEQSLDFYNASIIASAPMVALAANSPYFCQKSLWQETRIPLFEQSIPVESCNNHESHKLDRVTFGAGYLKESMLEPFIENRDCFPVLLPIHLQQKPEFLDHLRLQNGTIWRWNRPLVTVDDQGNPHLRIEHRTPASGTSAQDTIANIAFYLGLTHYLVNLNETPESLINFAKAKNNFYQAAKYGFDCHIEWINDQSIDMQSLLSSQLIPHAKQALLELGFDTDDLVQYFDDNLMQRARKACNGATWQKAFIAHHGENFQEMTSRYIENQEKNLSVHEWSL